ncbi:hypothetical protein Rsub_06321 [Raphidocelis subcapitata]|uniref:Uncharacterized protein n=1 Tax=Raphidocelis subcapitata TaxID=307507 RepID=A0A2V0P147_9CHLO|nr:hypothetical protein Rsub_06321 [Raphidocelis subcapitata]|eukprot:GBF93601.1 hypothetical protein Rsub_06321 [Raphidocelis subcapitata]
MARIARLLLATVFALLVLLSGHGAQARLLRGGQPATSVPAGTRALLGELKKETDMRQWPETRRDIPVASGRGGPVVAAAAQTYSYTSGAVVSGTMMNQPINDWNVYRG